MSKTSPARTSSRSRNLKYILMLGALAALPAVTTDMYLPALPEVASDLATTTTAAQFTLSGTLLGTAVGQLVIGPLSDRFGRRLPLLIGISMHVVTSLLCAIAPNIGMLIGLRILQGFFNAAASVVAIAVIRDRFTGSDAARLLSRLMLMIGLAPLLAPTLGQAVAGIWAWRAVFYALALIGVILVVIVWRWMPETLPPERRLAKAKKGTPKSGKPGGYRVLLRDRRFLAFAVIPGLSMGIIMSYVVGSPFVMQEEYGLSPATFALIFAVNGVAMVVSSRVNASLLNRFPSAGILRIAAPVLLLLAVILPIIIATGFGGVIGLVAGLWVVLGMLGFIFQCHLPGAGRLRAHGRNGRCTAGLPAGGTGRAHQPAGRCLRRIGAVHGRRDHRLCRAHQRGPGDDAGLPPQRTPARHGCPARRLPAPRTRPNPPAPGLKRTRP